MVIIENQLEKSNHDHLGKLITYLTGMSAKAAIWIVSDPRPEHVAAVAWLDESSSAAFYMVKVEAVRIGESPAAPLFTLIVGPSEETKDVGQTKKEIAERYGIRKRWWTTLVDSVRNLGWPSIQAESTFRASQTLLTPRRRHERFFKEMPLPSRKRRLAPPRRCALSPLLGAVLSRQKCRQ